jgi:hypothetical protein
MKATIREKEQMREYYKFHKKEKKAYQKKNKIRIQKYVELPHIKKSRTASALKWYYKNKEKVDAYRTKYRHEHPHKYRRYVKNFRYNKKYGISWDKKLEMLRTQKHKCMICDKYIKSSQDACLDHRTGIVRDILCVSCNHGLGSFKDNIALLKQAIKYLIKWRIS